MYQIHKCHLSEEPFEENEDGHGDGDDEREGEGGAIEAGVDPKAIAADPSCDACCADTASTEEGGQNKEGAEFCNQLQLLDGGMRDQSSCSPCQMSGNSQRHPFRL